MTHRTQPRLDPPDDERTRRWLILRVLEAGPQRELALLLLRHADGSRLGQLPRSLDKAHVYALCDPGASDREIPAGAVVIMPTSLSRVVEFGALAIGEEWDGSHLGPQMVADVLDVLRAQGVRLVRATAISGETGRTAILRDAGFRVATDRGGPPTILLEQEL